MDAVTSTGAAALEQQLPQDVDSTKPMALFSQSKYAHEIADWLRNRAAPAEAQRYQKFMNLIQQAAVAPAPHSSNSTCHINSSKHRPASTLGFHAKKAPQAPVAAPKAHRPTTANPASSSWLHTSTIAAAGKLSSCSNPLPADGVISAGLRPCSSPAASAMATAADHQQPIDSSTCLSARKSAIVVCSAAAKSAGTCSSKCVNITTTQACHGLKELYPDLWASTVPICRPDPAPNKNFVSEWGESLRQGAGEAWAPYLATTYQLANLQVAKPTDEFAVRGDEALLDWAAKQKLYFGDVLTPQAAAAVQELLSSQPQQDIPAASDRTNVASLSAADRKGLLEVMRQVNAVVQPDSGQSVMKTVHRPQYSLEQPETTALMKEQTRIRTMGFPRKVQIKGFAQTATKTAEAKHSSNTHITAASPAVDGFPVVDVPDMSARAAEVDGSCDAGRGTNEVKGTKRPKASELVDTLNSKVPLKWAASAVHAPTSSYTASYGGNPGHAPQMFKTIFEEVNVGFGHVDQHMYPTSSCVYPVEQRYLQQHPKVEQDQKDLDMKTTQRMSYKPRDPDSVARSLLAAREQIEASQAARNKSFIPLSKAGVQNGSSAQWRSVYGSEFIPRKADLSANRAMASAVAGMFNGPTIAFGKIAGFRAEDVTRIAKHKAQEQALAAAKADAEAALDERAAAAAAKHS